MNTDKATDLINGELSEQVIGVFYSVYNELGSGFLESVYETAFALALQEGNLCVTRQAPINVQFRGHIVGEFRADMIVDQQIIIEVKAASRLTPVHDAQLINYLKATGIRLGLLFNFGPRPEFRRRVR